jgi:7-cyano-7-deazaguanine synthase
MTSIHQSCTVGVLASGGLDSCVLVADRLRAGFRVQPFFVRCGLAWEGDELAALGTFLGSVKDSRLDGLVVLDLPLADLYGEHWSVSGLDVPDAKTGDSAVYLPGRNALLAIKPAVWCAMHGIEELALAVLAGNPFSDATEEFFGPFETAIGRAVAAPIRLICPFAHLSKAEVLERGRGLPLALTFSCIAPVAGRHCGRCNKCAERQHAFRAIGMDDPTEYAKLEGLRIGD